MIDQQNLIDQNYDYSQGNLMNILIYKIKKLYKKFCYKN